MQLRIRVWVRTPVSWEEAFARMSLLPRLFAEPDGSFLWSGEEVVSGLSIDGVQPGASSGSRHWQLEGTVYDDGLQVRRIELVGNCSVENWSRLLECFRSDWHNVGVEDLIQNRPVDGQWLRASALTMPLPSNE